MYRKITVEIDIYLNDSEGEPTKDELQENDNAINDRVKQCLGFPAQNVRIIGDSMGRIVGEISKTHWQDAMEQLVDSDGGKPEKNRALELMAEYRETDSIGGYYFKDPETGDFDWETGPSLNEIDWTGFEEAFSRREGSNEN